jgi:hypothetical protein
VGTSQRPEILVRLTDEFYLKPAQATSLAALDADQSASQTAETVSKSIEVVGKPQVQSSQQEVAEPEDPAPQAPEAEKLASKETPAERIAGEERAAARKRWSLPPPPEWAGISALPPEPSWRPRASYALAEREPNGGTGTATWVEPDAKVTMSISEIGDADWLAFSVGHPGELTLPRGDIDWLLVEAPSAGKLKVIVDEVAETLDVWVRLWNADGEASQWYGPPRSGGVTEAAIPILRPGIYRLEVADGNNDARSTKPYRLTGTFHPAQ